MSEHTKEPFHAEIYLQTPCRDRMSEMYGEVTWCEDKINDDDTKYVRSDLFDDLTKQRDDLLAALEKTYSKLKSATMCHPNAVEYLVEEAFQITDAAIASVKDHSEQHLGMGKGGA